MAPHHSMLIKAAFALAMALNAAAVPKGPQPSLRASALETGHHAEQTPSMFSGLGQLPDLPPLGGTVGTQRFSTAMKEIPGASAFFAGRQANGMVNSGAGWSEITGGAPAPAAGPQAGAPGGPPPPAAPGAAAAPAAGPVLPPNPDRFFDRMTEMLTCQRLEQSIAAECGSTPLFEAVTQFENTLEICQQAVLKIPGIGGLFAEYFGSGANCRSLLQGWKFNGYSSIEVCQQTIRRKDFKVHCRLI